MTPHKLPALLVIDLQNWFLEKGSEEKLKAVPILIEKTNELIQFFHQHNWPIVRVQTVHKSDKSTWNQWALAHNVPRLIEGSHEANYAKEVIQKQTDIILTKTRLSAFLRTNLEATLLQLNCNRVVICGYSTDNCVGQTSMDAYELDFKVFLAGEAILGTHPKDGKLMLDYLDKHFGILPQSNSTIIQRLSP
ncbi:MAG: isochorismatase family cysteine hydrolase [Bacteroidota bacterium]